MRQRVLGLFAKWPCPGAVKTRLGGPPDWGAAVARAFLLDALDRLAAVPARRVVAFAPPEAGPAFAEVVRGRFELVPQSGGDLGQRLRGFFAQELAAGAGAVVVVGTDSPTMPVEHVESAFCALESGGANVVLGPAQDGGYYLVGCGAELPPLFEGIAWSSATVLADSVARLGAPAWRLALLPPWYDVDTPEDWEMLRGHVAALRRAGMDPGAPHTEALLASARPSV
jgi:rSAM/selenodomain-associated transferase 1